MAEDESTAEKLFGYGALVIIVYLAVLWHVRGRDYAPRGARGAPKL